MAYKTSPNSLIHCNECGEDYSATYKRCPFCGAKSAPPQSDPDRPVASSDLDDTFVFDGQDLFDDKDEDDGVSSRPRGGKRLAEKPSSNPFANADINWPRMITFICSLVIIVAAMVIVFTWIYPQLRGDPTANNSQSPSSGVTDPGSDASQSVDPSAAVSDPAVTDPVTDSSASVSPVGSGGLKGFTTNIYGEDAKGFSLGAGESWQMRLTFDPANWSGEVTYSISDTRYATVSANGNVVNVNQDTRLHGVILTITAGGITLEMPVYCAGVTATQPPVTETPVASDPPASNPPASDPPASNPPASDPPATQAPSGSGITVGKGGTIVNAPTGVYVRSGPGTSYGAIASLFSGDEIIKVVEDAGGGWYKITFYGETGETEGYVMGEFISTN